MTFPGPSDHAVLQQMAAESCGLHGSGLLAFQILGPGEGDELVLAARMGSPLARSIVRARAEYMSHIGSAPRGSVQCMLCSNPFTVPDEPPLAVLVVRAAIPEPSVFCTSGICAACCMTLDWPELRRQTMLRYQTVFPRLRALPPVGALGHA